MISQLAGLGVAVITAATPSPAFSLAASPAHVNASAGQVVVFHAINNGSQPLHISATLRPVTRSAGHCAIGQGAVQGVTIAPSSFTIARGRARVVHVRISRTAPSADLAVTFTTRAGDPGNAQISAAVASQLVIHGSGKPAHECLTAASAARRTASVSPLLAGGTAIGILVVAALTGLTLRRVSHRRPRGRRARLRRA